MGWMKIGRDSLQFEKIARLRPHFKPLLIFILFSVRSSLFFSSLRLHFAFSFYHAFLISLRALLYIYVCVYNTYSTLVLLHKKKQTNKRTTKQITLKFLCFFFQFIFHLFYIPFFSVYLVTTDSNARQREDQTCVNSYRKAKSR